MGWILPPLVANVPRLHLPKICGWSLSLSPFERIAVLKQIRDDALQYDALSPLLGAASARLGSSSLEQQDATIG